MGLITSRLNIGSLPVGRRRSNDDEETMFSYSLNKNYFSNYFFMGGERFEVNDPDYLFGDSCDLNFLTCTKPYSLPYKKAQRNLLTNLNTKHKAINKVSSRVGEFTSPLNILRGRQRQSSLAHKQDAQTQTLNEVRSNSNGLDPSQPLVMLINIRKETLRLVKAQESNVNCDQNSLRNSPTGSPNDPKPSNNQKKCTFNASKHCSRNGQKSRSHLTNRYSLAGSQAATVQAKDNAVHKDHMNGESIELEHTMYGPQNYGDLEICSIVSNTLSASESTNTTSSTSKSGYTSVRDVPLSEFASDDNDEQFEDALNEPTNTPIKDMHDNNFERNPHKSLSKGDESTSKSCDIKITIDGSDEFTAYDAKDEGLDCKQNLSDIEIEPLEIDLNQDIPDGCKLTIASHSSIQKLPSTKILTKVNCKNNRKKNSNGQASPDKRHQSVSSSRVYNIEFNFDAEVDCSIRISYFCTREVNSNNVTYKPQHASYKSKTYTYRRGLNQKFKQPEHTFQPYLFDEDLLIYKPLDLDGNYNSGAVFPIVIHCAALEGPSPKQSQSLVATVEKSHLDESYSIKPLKQLIFVDGVQYILQDIYGIENKPLKSNSTDRKSLPKSEVQRNLRSSCNSLYSISNMDSNLKLSDTASLNSVVDTSLDIARNRGSLVSNQFRSIGSENTFECVICMSEERDTMLLPCRHMCLCSSCSQSLRYQSSSCPICRCPFKAALNLRFIQRNNVQSLPLCNINCENSISQTKTADTSPEGNQNSGNNNKSDQETTASNLARRESLTNSATPLLAVRRATDKEGRRSSQAVSPGETRHSRLLERNTTSMNASASREPR